MKNWIKRTEALPTKLDQDQFGRVWAYDTKHEQVVMVHIWDFSCRKDYSHWIPTNITTPPVPDAYSLRKREESDKGMYGHVKSVAEKAQPRFSVHVALKLMEEVGELTQEINIKEGFLNKPKGKDGIIGEAVDVIITAMDLIWLENPDLTETQLMEIAKNKLRKWESISKGE